MLNLNAEPMVRKSRKNAENLSKIKIYWTTVNVVELKKEKKFAKSTLQNPFQLL